MEDLAHFIQSMSEKYGLLDASHIQGANNNNNDKQQQQQQHLQDHTSSAASNTLNSEERQGSSWECLSIFISGSQSIDCNTLQSASPHHALPALNSSKKQAPFHQQQKQQEADNNSLGSPPLHCFSKLIDIDEHKCTPYNTSAGSASQQQLESPDNKSSHIRALSTALSNDIAERGTIFDNCGDLSTVVTMSDYVPKCYYPNENNSNNTMDGTQLLDASSCPRQYFSKNSGDAQLLQQPTKNAPAAAISKGNSTAAVQEMHITRGIEGSGGVPYKDFKEMLLHPGRLLNQEDKKSFESKSAIGIAAMSGLVQGQHANNRTRLGSGLGRSSSSASLDPEAESGGFDMTLPEYDVSSGRTSRNTYIDTEGYCYERGLEASYQTGDLRENRKDMVQTKSEGRSSSRGQCHGAAQSFDTFQSFDSERERRERGVQLMSGYNCSSTDMSPRPAENGHKQDEHETAASLTSLDYLPITSAMQSRVAQLDEVSKELFASRNNTTQNSNQLNLTLGLFQNEEFRQNCSSSSDKPLALKKARSVKDFSHTTAAACVGKAETDPKLSMPKDNTAPSMKNFAQPESNNSNKRTGVSSGKLRNHPDNNPHSTIEEAKVTETWEKVEDLHKVAGMEGGGAVREPKWSQINRMLCENGFPPLDWQLIGSTTDVADKFFHTLHDVLRNYGRREKVVQELLAEKETLRKEEEHSNEIIQKLEYDADLVKRKLATSEQRAELANAAAEKTYSLLRKDNQRLEASHANMLQRCSQLEHGLRAKERALRKLQEKIQEAVQREERQRQKERELYEKLKHKIAIEQKSQGEVIESNFLLKDLKPATIVRFANNNRLVGIYERQRAAAQVEMKSLRDENSRLCQELCEKENSILSKMQAMSTADERERVLSQQLTEIDSILKTKTSSCQRTATRGDTALLPLAVNRKEELKEEMQRESCAAEEQSPSMSLLQSRQMDAAQSSKSHRALQEVSRRKLDLNSSSTLLASNLTICTSTECQEFQKDICTQLKVADPIRITGAIDGLLKVVAAVPRMEKFIEQVCDIVFNGGATMLARDSFIDTQETPEAVPGILKSWLEKLLSVEELQQFKDSVSAQLWERFDEKAAKHPMTSRVAAASVKDLIDSERQYPLSQASYREGEISIKAEPQKLLHCIIKHFQMLFEIQSLEGVMAVMNSVYIQISEYHNFARALCSMLGLPKDARPNSIISTITSIVNKT
ncbi:unnamed protein product [Calypogeia fissa]